MKLEMQMTERDKKLLVFLAIFVIVVGLGYWGIRPIIMKIMDIDDEIVKQEDLSTIYELKIVELPAIEIDNEIFEEEIEKARKNYFEMLESNEVDKLMTGIALSYNLYCYDLSISMPSGTATSQAYKYSEKYESDRADAEMLAAQAEAEELMRDSYEYDDLYEDSFSVDYSFDDELTGVYEVGISMRLGGDEEDLQDFIDDYSNNDKEFLITSYNWSDTNQMTYDPETDEYLLVSDRILNISMKFYMCDSGLEE